MTTVTQGDWNVSVETSSAYAGARLSVFRGFWRGRARYGEPHGRWFPTREAAWAFVLEHGYTQPYRVGWCRRCRKQHWFCGGRMGDCAATTRPYPGCEASQQHFDATAHTRRPKEPRA